MYLGTFDLLAIIIAMTTSIVVVVLAVRQNAQLHRDNINLRRKIRLDKELRS